MANKREFKWVRHTEQYLKAHPKEPTFYKDYWVGYEKDLSKVELHAKEQAEKAGIYVILCEVSKSVYVGQSKDVENRLRNHKMCIIRPNYKSTIYLRMRKDYEKHGIECFSFMRYKKCLPQINELLRLEEDTMREFVGLGYKLYNVGISSSVRENDIYCPEQYQEIIKKTIAKMDDGIFVKQLTDLL